jgi:hypothetical protein
MKTTPYILSIILLAALTSRTTYGLDLGKFTDRATEAISGADSGSANLLSIGSDLLNSFKGNEQAMDAAKGLLNTFKTDNFSNAFDYYDQIKAAGLKPSQLATWNDTKNSLSAMILERNFDFKQAKLSDLVGKASGALMGNDTDEASRYLTQLKDAATLTGDQKSLLQNIQSNLLPVK